MKVRELIELNQMITDIEITMRDAAACHMLDQLNIGPAQGIKPPYPTRVPKRADWWKQQQRSDDKFYKDAAYIDKSINSSGRCGQRRCLDRQGGGQTILENSKMSIFMVNG